MGGNNTQRSRRQSPLERFVRAGSSGRDRGVRSPRLLATAFARPVRAQRATRRHAGIMFGQRSPLVSDPVLSSGIPQASRWRCPTTSCASSSGRPQRRAPRCSRRASAACSRISRDDTRQREAWHRRAVKFVTAAQGQGGIEIGAGPGLVVALEAGRCPDSHGPAPASIRRSAGRPRRSRIAPRRWLHRHIPVGTYPLNGDGLNDMINNVCG